MSVEHMDIMKMWICVAKSDKGKYTDLEGKRGPYQNPGRHGNVGTQEVPVLGMKRKQANSEQESQRRVLRHGLSLLTPWAAHANGSSKHLPLLKEENSICPYFLPQE